MPAKKAPKNPGRDARRAFEHLGRVQAMANSLSVGHSPLATLVSAADAAFQSGKFEESAHLLRAAEHLLFAAIVNTSQGKTPPLLLQAIEEEFEHLNERAADHGHGANLTREIRSIYSQMTDDAAK